uniref:IclR family transcriptional regulator domain-containing protein n=1 Tax=Marinobacterium profundum TaxID=1714300 RepID=UPI0008342F73|nr:IclR family transcriptional regulator C-terminal domain-containing protein [Marinobacterium profundum]
MSVKNSQPGAVDKDFLATFARGLEVIKSFDTQTPSMSLTDVAKKNNLSRASARRFLLTLQKLGYVKSDDKRFKLTARVLELGYSYLATLNFSETITPFMEKITHKLGESCSATVLDGQDVVYIARIPVRGLIPVNLQIGARLPAYATSMGRVLLAALPEDQLEAFLSSATLEPLTPYTVTAAEQLRSEIERVRRQAYCIIDQELELGLRTVAVPVYDRNQHVCFALNVSSHVSKVSLERAEREFVPLMQQVSQQITAALP